MRRASRSLPPCSSSRHSVCSLFSSSPHCAVLCCHAFAPDAVMNKPGSHTAKVEALLSVSKLSERLKEFISAKARTSDKSGQVVVTRQDIEEFFSTLPNPKDKAQDKPSD